MGPHGFGASFGDERRAAGEEVEERSAQAVQVGRGIGADSADDFRGDKQRGADPAMAVGQGVVGDIFVDHRQTEVGDFASPAAREHQVGGFDIAVNDPQGMSGGQGFGGFSGELAGALNIERAGGIDHFGKAAAFEQFHGDVADPAEFTGFKNLHDVRMFQRGGGAGFGDEVLGIGIDLPAAVVQRDDFQCDPALEGFVIGAEDPAHGALADDGLEAESPMALAKPAGAVWVESGLSGLSVAGFAELAGMVAAGRPEGLEELDIDVASMRSWSIKQPETSSGSDSNAHRNDTRHASFGNRVYHVLVG